MRDKIKGLNVGELLKNTYSKLLERHSPQEIVFPTPALAEIATHADYHKPRRGYMCYERVGLFELNGYVWAIARGEAAGGYPADPYDSDILALEFKLKGPIKGKGRKKTEGQIQEELRELIEGSKYFANSLFHGRADGTLAVSENSRFRERILEILGPVVEEFIVQKPKYDSRRYLVSTLSPVCKSPVKYKREFADFLADSIEAVLEQYYIKTARPFNKPV
jgi:hypothetical protein